MRRSIMRVAERAMIQDTGAAFLFFTWISMMTHQELLDSRKRFIAKSMPRTLQIAVVLSCLVAVGGCNRGGNSGGTEQTETAGENVLILNENGIPQGATDMSVDYLIGLDDKPLPEDLESRSQEIKNRMRIRVDSCNELFNRELDRETKLLLTRMKLDSLRTLAAVDPDTSAEDFDSYLNDLISAKDDSIRKLAQLAKFQANVNRFAANQLTDQPIAKELVALLDNPDSIDFATVRKSIGWILPTADNSLNPEAFQKRLFEAAKCYRILGNRFANHSDPEIANQAKQLSITADDLVVDAIRSGAPDSTTATRNDLFEYLTSGFETEGNDLDRLNVGLRTAEALEFEGMQAQALIAYEIIADHFEKSDRALASQAMAYLDSAKIRLNLVGQKLYVTGILQDGTRFDWQGYRGKPTLVCYWATYAPFFEDAKQIQQMVKPFADKLQVITVNLDDRKTLQEYGKGKEDQFIWPTVVSSDPNASGFEQANAKKNGIVAIPFLVLVNPDGTVDGIHVFGERLSNALQQMFAGQN